MIVRSCIYCDSTDYTYDHTDWDDGTVVYRCLECGQMLYPEDFNYSEEDDISED